MPRLAAIPILVASEGSPPVVRISAPTQTVSPGGYGPSRKTPGPASGGFFCAWFHCFGLRNRSFPSSGNSPLNGRFHIAFAPRLAVITILVASEGSPPVARISAPTQTASPGIYKALPPLTAGAFFMLKDRKTETTAPDCFQENASRRKSAASVPNQGLGSGRNQTCSWYSFPRRRALSAPTQMSGAEDRIFPKSLLALPTGKTSLYPSLCFTRPEHARISIAWQIICLSPKRRLRHLTPPCSQSRDPNARIRRQRG